jgi:hypothetical protein
MGLLHEYERTVVIRLRTRVYDDGGAVNYVRVHSDASMRDKLLGWLVRAQHVVLCADDIAHEEIKTASLTDLLGEWIIEDEEEAEA